MQNKILSILIAIVMVLTIAPVSAFAEDDILSYLNYEINNGEVTITNCDRAISGEVIIPDTIEGYPVTTIGWESFANCQALTSITIPDSVTSIGDGTFAYCSALESVTIPDSVTSIGSSAFFGTAYYNASSNWENGVLYINNHLIAAKDYITECTIKEGTVTIASESFIRHYFTSVTIPDSVTSIGRLAFAYCDALTSVTIGNGVTSIGDGTFFMCDALTRITIPDSVESIGFGAFEGCNSLTSVTIPDSVTSIGAYAFGYYFDENTLLDCLVDGFTIYGYADTAAETYANENGITFITIEPGEDVVIPDEPTPDGPVEDTPADILGYLFYEINNGEVTITDCDESIRGDITILDAIEGYPVTSIGEGAFNSCDSLTSVTIPDSVTSIGYGTFNDCDNLTSIAIPDSVTSIGDYAFFNCDSLVNITVDENNAYYSSDEYGVLFNKDKTELIQYPKGNNRTEYVIPNSVTSIGRKAFYDCDTLTSVIICNSVTIIGDYAFAYCDALTNITIPGSVTSISIEAFRNCSALTSVTICNGVKSISFSAFYSCDAMTSITIPDSVTSISKKAFGYYFDENTCEHCLVDGFTIYGYADTAAETYAKENNIKFIEITEEDVTPDNPSQDTASTLNPNKDSHITVKDTVATVIPEMDSTAFKGNITNENVQILDKDGNELATDTFVGTGAKINILDTDGKVLSTYEVMVKSDVDGNGKVTPADARLALRAAAGLDTIAGVYETAANFDEKDTISTSDARMILRKAAGLE